MNEIKHDYKNIIRWRTVIWRLLFAGFWFAIMGGLPFIVLPFLLIVFSWKDLLSFEWTINNVRIYSRVKILELQNCDFEPDFFNGVCSAMGISLLYGLIIAVVTAPIWACLLK